MQHQSYIISGAGSGIGKGIAFRIAQSDPGSRIYLLGRNRDALEGVRRELPRPNDHCIVSANLRDRKALSQAIRSEKLETKNLVGVIANAGIGGENEYGPNDRWDEVIETNLTGTYCFVQECLPALRESKKEFRNIVVVSSILARLGIPKYSAYCASKAGLLGLTRSWAAELARDKILVNAICPGWVDTAMATQGIHAAAERFRKTDQEVRKIEMSRVPLGKMSQPEEIADLVYYLLANQTSFTGQSFDINNGALMP